jgi:protein-tyrosine phosphatase
VRLLVLVALLLTACSPTTYTHGVPNLAQVDKGVWRSGQITTAEGWAYIKAVSGAKRVHVVKLNFPGEGSDSLAVDAGYDVHVLSIEPEGDKDAWGSLMQTLVLPDPVNLAKAEKLLEGATPDDVVLVHCTHGQDRTGLVVGIYRLAHGWTKDAAYAEMLQYGFHPELLGLRETWENIRP